ncbi:alkanesulfonate monooxygenase SsuD/methylene tetrahydromethanopterin reductase-like flavin-dependent oxidoreductase (luciferase family) [Streptomyces sp. V3I8]|uniref:LLM class flavin-dependent oxidoreductase n=1 Tax=Streptomyces sp. V3I8 TaxID=3042279 RepID=UPI002786CDB9|nr:LLM class flavin-dependent oxidoreductase [Streptomyces sp. V3I8]MDQ1041761.1 alkanesulfonate monooxygenase SsuD/methylene tetrahydromethanopterin reductase-like flavin-dependent oxidoreductase (luciferase family) [Streptomyces sp. V3I8]
MRFGLIYLLQNPRPWTEDGEEKTLNEALEQIELADRLGFDTVWASEHHFLDEYSHSSAPEVFLAAAAARTTNIRLAHGIVTLPPAVNHPARIAERIAMLDLVSGGRVEFGSGQGSTQHELGAFGVDRATKREQWREAIGVITRMLTEVPFTGHQGQWIDMPPRNVLPKPKQKPHPPLWVACSSPETVETAARNGVGALSFAFMTPEEATERVGAYYRTIESEDCVPVGKAVNANFAVALPFLCHRDEEIAYERAMGGVDFYVNSFMHFYVQGGHRPGTTVLSEEFAKQPPVPPENAERMDKVVRRGIGTPDKLAEMIRVQEAAGVDEIIFQVQLGSNSHEHICESLELFAREVMPEFAGRREAAELAKQDRLAVPLKNALERIEAPAVDVSDYVIRTDMEEFQNPRPTPGN